MPKLSQAQRSNLSESRILAAAVRLIVERGLGGTHLTDVGLQAGYSRGLAAMRFGTKAQLIARVARHGVAIWLERLDAAVHRKRGLQAVFAAIDAQSLWMVENPSEMRALYLIVFQSFDPSSEYRFDVEHLVAAQRRDMSRWLREAHADGHISASIDLDQEVQQILATMLGFVYQSLVDASVDITGMHAKLKADIRARLGG